MRGEFDARNCPFGYSVSFFPMSPVIRPNHSG
jgi:hypothetical protein